MYFFFRKFKNIGNDKDVLFQDVIECENRDKAKEYIKNNYGDYPFRKSKNSEFYYYLCESDENWYDYYHKVYHIKCLNCGKEIEVIGGQNLIKSKYGEYCSYECREEHYNKKRAEYPWIDKNDVVCVQSTRGLVGYIYRITNKRTMKSYIGKTKNAPLFRWWQHLKSSEKKFERENITDLVFEVLEIVTYDEQVESDKYNNGEEKMSFREMFYITHYNTIENGYNVMLEKTKLDGYDYQLSLELEE